MSGDRPVNRYQSGYQPNEVIFENALVCQLNCVIWVRRCKSIIPPLDFAPSGIVCARPPNSSDNSHRRPPLSTDAIIGATNSAAYGGLVFALSYPRYFRHKSATKSEQDQSWLRRTLTTFGLSRKTYCQGREVCISLHLYENLS